MSIDARHAAATLFGALLAGQMAQLVLSPVLPAIAADLGISSGAAGQLRALSGAVAVGGALLLVRVARRVGIRDAILAGLILLAAGAAGGALAPSLGTMALAQVPTGLGLAFVLSGGLAAVSSWAPPEERARVLTWALLGQPVAWVIGMPLVGAAAEGGWRLALLVPLAPAAVAAAIVARRPSDRPEAPRTAGVDGHRPRGLVRWSIGELLAYTAWCGTLVYSGSLLVDAYGASAASVGLVLAGAGAAYVPGNLLGRRLVQRRTRAGVVWLAAAGAPLLLALGALSPGLAASAAVLALLSALSGARTVAGSALGLQAGGRAPLAAMSLRTAAVQGGYLGGAAIGGLALVGGGHGALGWTLAVILAASAAVHASAWVGSRPRRLEALPTGAALR